jgi:hypothetical protein
MGASDNTVGKHLGPGNGAVGMPADKTAPKQLAPTAHRTRDRRKRVPFWQSVSVSVI